MGQSVPSCCGAPDLSLEAELRIIEKFESLAKDPSSEFTGVVQRLSKVTEEQPYLRPIGTERYPHPLLYWVRKCREQALARNLPEAEQCLDRIIKSLDYERNHVADAFKRFDVDNSGQLDGSEFQCLVAYIGWGEEEASLMDRDKDSFVTLTEFQDFVGDMGGLQQVFEQRRKRVARKQWGVEAPAVIEIGSRVKAYFHDQAGKKSSTWKEAQVLAVKVPPSNGVELAFGFGEANSWKTDRQVVPVSWIFSDVHDAEVVTALREVGILEEQQAFWASIFPASEMRAVEKLVPCQRKALATVREVSARNHEEALPQVREKFQTLGYSEKELQAVLGWIQDLAPMCVHIHIDSVGRFLEKDEFYRSQFETKTSNGALDDDNSTRKDWEEELFGGAYHGCKAFERCKYGALGVMNDYRGVTSAWQYGDSYLVLKDVRLRATFAAEDSGGISGSQLAVLDKYAHVLKDYSDRELRGLIDVAVANTSLADGTGARARLLRGSADDTTKDWVTFGFPDAAQQKGCFFFEVELLAGCRSPQVGFLSSQFLVAPRSNEFRGGVGDDEHGWAVDGQHAMLWHAGKQLAWNQIWESDLAGNTSSSGVWTMNAWNTRGQLLKDGVIVGVAVDLDQRRMWFSSNGQWDESPAFSEGQIPKGVKLYPAVSLKGAAAFDFGPNFKHSPPSVPGKTFLRWPGMMEGSHRLDNALIGNSDMVSNYKEIQVHGELSLKRNVQRLVANRKYLDMRKADRSWALLVEGCGPGSGKYQRTGAKHGFPLYTLEEKPSDGSKQEGKDAEDGTTMAKTPYTIYWHKDSKRWRLGPLDSKDYVCEAAMEESSGSLEPPRNGWEVPKKRQGSVSAAAFKTALEKAGLKSRECSQLIAALAEPGANKAKKGREKMVYKVTEKSSLQAELKKLSEISTSAEEVWSLAVQEAQALLLKEEFKLPEAAVVETEHPYPAASDSWTQSVILHGTTEMDVQFAKQSCTLDSCAKLEIYAGGLAKLSTGRGTRVQITGVSSDELVHGTVEEQDGMRWKVLIDNDEAEICGGFRSWLEEADDRSCICYCCARQQKVVSVSYEGKMGEEILSFKLDRSCPLQPFTVDGLAATGPAREQGVQKGWFLDVQALIDSEAFRSLEGSDLGPTPSNLEEVAGELENFERRLKALRDSSGVELVFTNGLDYKLLPMCHISYHEAHGPVKNEISELNLTNGTVIVGAMKEGPAFASGVREGWELDIGQTLQMQSNKGTLKGVTEEALLKDPAAILELSDVSLAFAPADPVASLFFEGYGTSRPEEAEEEEEPEYSQDYEEDSDYFDSEEEEDYYDDGHEDNEGELDIMPFDSVTIPYNQVDFVWTTDGDGSGYPKRRWGFFAVAKPAGTAPLSEDKMNLLVRRWKEVSSLARGVAAGKISVEPEDWDEARLRALCARHGWEFEWMTEEGERQRRIDGARLGRQVATKKGAEESSPWWRLI